MYRLLIVDDEQKIVKLAQDYLEQSKFRVEGRANG